MTDRAVSLFRRFPLLSLAPLALASACVEAPEDAEPLEEPAAADDLPDRGTARVWTAAGVLRVTFERDGDRVVFQDDMTAPVAGFRRAMIDDDEWAALAAGELRPERAAVRAIGRYRWSGGVVPFRFDGELPEARRQVVRDAIAHWEEHTDFDFVERTNQADFVEFRLAANDQVAAGTTCRADVGRVGGEQEVTVNQCSRRTIIHEIGHAVGFYHEHTRLDRDQYVEILWDNIVEGREDDFERYDLRVDSQTGHVRDGTDAGPYDYSSVMHYFATSGGGGATTIVPLQSGVTLGGNVLSAGDIAAANQLVRPGGISDDTLKVTLYAGSSYSGAAVQLSQGYYNGFSGGFGAVGDNNISSMYIPPGLMVRAGEGDVDAPRRNFGQSQAVMPAGWNDAISWMYVTPAVRVYRDPNQGGVAQSFYAGTWRNDQGHFDVIGNDTISSIFVPTAMVAELCWSETGSGSTGTTYCRTFEPGAHNVTGTLDNQTSLLRVKPAVTLFQESDLWGNRKTLPVGNYGPGSWTPIEGDSISSMIIDDTLAVMLCTDLTFQYCQVYRGVVSFLGGPLNDNVGFIAVTTNTYP